MKIKEILKNEISGWKKLEVIWLLLACFIICALSIYWNDSFMGIVSATTGVACVVCTGKGKLSAYVFGLVNCVLYAIISYNAGVNKVNEWIESGVIKEKLKFDDIPYDETRIYIKKVLVNKQIYSILYNITP